MGWGKSSGGEVEHQHFGILAVVQAQLSFAAQRDGVAGAQQLVVDGQAAAHQVHVGQALGTGDAALLSGEAALRLDAGRDAEVLVFDLAP